MFSPRKGLPRIRYASLTFKFLNTFHVIFHAYFGVARKLNRDERQQIYELLKSNLLLCNRIQ